MSKNDKRPTVLSSWVIFWGEIGKEPKRIGEKGNLINVSFQKKATRRNKFLPHFSTYSAFKKERRERDGSG